MPAGPVLAGGLEEDAGTGHHGAAQDGSLSRAGVPTLPVIPQGLGPVPALAWLCFLLWRFEFSSLLCLPEGLWGWHEMEGAEGLARQTGLCRPGEGPAIQDSLAR